MLYQSIIQNTKDKRRIHHEKLNEAFKKAMDLLKKDHKQAFRSIVGSKLLQIMLKYGRKDIKEYVQLLVLQ